MDLTDHLRNCDGKVPQGTFFADLTDEQLRAISLQEELGRELQDDYPEIVDLYRDLDHFRTLDEIGRAYLDEIHSPEVRRHAVAYAIKGLISSAELSDLQLKRRRMSLANQFGSFESEAFRDHCRAAAIKRNLEASTDVEAMIRGRGRTPWSDEERDFLFRLVANPEYQLQSGQHMGKPNYELIALELNIRFHSSEEVRFTKSVGNYVRDMRRQGKLIES